MRKAEFASHIIMFVLGLVVIAGVLFFGYQVIANMQQERCDVQRVQFGTQLQSHIDRNKGWGTNRVISIDMPCEAEHVCFVSRNVIDSYAFDGSSQTLTGQEPARTNTRPLMEASVNSGDKTNVFTVQIDGTLLPVQRFSAQSAAINVESGNLICIQAVAGRANIRMKGNGNIVTVSQG